MDIERLSNLCSESAMLREVHLSILDEIPSLPVDFVVSRLVKRSKTDPLCSFHFDITTAALIA